jgi:hypothetical protein
MSRKLAKKQDMLNQLEHKQKKPNSEGDYSGDEYDDGKLPFCWHLLQF